MSPQTEVATGQAERQTGPPNPAAFPRQWGPAYEAQQGMSLLDYIAAQIMGQFIGRLTAHDLMLKKYQDMCIDGARMAYAAAQAMLYVREEVGVETTRAPG